MKVVDETIRSTKVGMLRQIRRDDNWEFWLYL